MATIVRTYETFEVEFSNEDGTRCSVWSGYHTEAEAAAVVARSSRPAKVLRRTFDVSFEAGSRLLELANRHGQTPIAEVTL